MKKFLPLLVCLLLSIFTVARATKPAYTPAPNTKTAQEESTGQEADAKPLLKDANTDEEVGSDDDNSVDDASGDQGEDMNDDDGSGAVGDEGTGADGGGDDDDDDGASDDGGGDEGE
jgi:hypothetical protein